MSNPITYFRWIYPSITKPNPILLPLKKILHHPPLLANHNSSTKKIKTLPENPKSSTTLNRPQHSNQITTTLPELPNQPEAIIPPTLTHQMTTRFQVGAHKPNPKFAMQVSKEFDNKHALICTIEFRTISQAMQRQDWRDAMTKELNALVDNKTWKLVPKDDSKNIMGNKWVLYVKSKSDGNSLLYFLGYVDDLILTGNNDKMVQEFLDKLFVAFSLKDIDALNFFLGFEDRQTLFDTTKVHSPLVEEI